MGINEQRHWHSQWHPALGEKLLPAAENHEVQCVGDHAKQGQTVTARNVLDSFTYVLSRHHLLPTLKFAYTDRILWKGLFQRV